MWPFKAKPTDPELWERLENTQRALRAAEMDIEDLFDRLKRLTGRLAKRGDLSPIPEPEPAANGQPAARATLLGGLSDRQVRINEEILAKRGKRVLPSAG